MLRGEQLVNEIDEIKKRIRIRKNQKRQLTDYHFKRLYNGMIKTMVVLLVVVTIGAYVKVSPNGTLIKDYIFNDQNFKQSINWIQTQFHTLLNKDNSVLVSKKVSYTHLKDNYYTNQSNEVLNFEKGRVIYVGEQNMLGHYVTVLLENNVEVTFGNMNDVFVNLYDQVDAATILGTYQDKVLIVFTQGEKELDYETFEEFIE